MKTWDSVKVAILATLIFLAIAFLAGLYEVIGHPDKYDPGSFIVGTIFEVVDVVAIVWVWKHK